MFQAMTIGSIVHRGSRGMLDGKVLCLNQREVVANAQEAIQSAWRRLHAQSPDVPLPPGLL